MSFADGRRRRQVVPRWRPWWVTAKLGLADTGVKSRVICPPDTTTIDRRCHDWQQHRDLPHAADLISTAFGMGLGERAREAAEFVLNVKTHLPRPLVLLSKTI